MRVAILVAVMGLWALPAPAIAKSPAPCGPGDRPEPGLQGQVPAAIHGEESNRGFWCNMRLVGHTDIDNRGANYGLAWSGDCAYATTFGAGEDAPGGMAVIDVGDPRRPRVVEYHGSPGSLNAAETLHARDAADRRVLVVGSYDGNQLDVYDAADCRHPKLMSTFETPHNIHNITLSHDARTLYIATALPTSESNVPAPHIQVLDLAQLAAPVVLTTISMTTFIPDGARPAPLGVHRVDVSKDGTRIYAGVITAPSLVQPLLRPYGSSGELAIIDTTEIAQRKPEPQARFVAQFDNAWHGPRWFKTGGRTYVVSGDEAINNARPASSCGGPFPMIGDITDETAPKPVGQFELEINRPENCPASLEDGLLYSTHYTDVDDQDDAALGLFPMYNSGLRIADIRDPAKPVEVGYFNPPNDLDTKFGATYGNKPEVIDLTPSNIRYRPETGHIWMLSIASGFRVVELTPTGPAQQLGLPPAAPPAPACARTLRIGLRAPRGQRLRSARIYVNGRLVRTVRGRSLRVPVTLRRLPTGRIRVRIVARTTKGRRIVRSRGYSVCR